MPSEIVVAVCLVCVTLSAAAETQAATQGQPATRSGCGHADPSYIRTANETGGVPMFLDRSEAGKIFQLVRESTRNNTTTIYWATAPFAGHAKTIEIPVDSAAERITFTFSTDTRGGNFILTAPSGSVVRSGDKDVELTELSCGRIVTMAKPQPGTWKSQLTGNGNYWLEAETQSQLHIVSVEFVKPGGRPGHEGLFRIKGQPLAGTVAQVEATASMDAAKSAEFFLMDLHGERIGKLPMHVTSHDLDVTEFLGSLRLPEAPFRVGVSGRDAHGEAYQRVFNTLFHAESVEVIPTLTFDELGAGETKDATFTIRNIGQARSYKITATDTRRFVKGAEPSEVAIGANQTANVRVTLSIAAAEPAGREDTLVVVATSTAGPATSNSAVVELPVKGR